MPRKKLTRDMKTVCKTVAGRMLREYRIRLGLPAEAVAREVGRTKEYWCKVERGDYSEEARRLLSVLAELEAEAGKIDEIIKAHVRLYRESKEPPQPEPSDVQQANTALKNLIEDVRCHRAKQEKKQGHAVTLIAIRESIAALDDRLSYLETELGVVPGE